MPVGSGYVSGQNSSGKSLTAIVCKEEDNFILRLGPVPLSKGGICARNEIGHLGFEDLSHLLDFIEEGMSTINKYGVSANILGPTVVIASANPRNNFTWNSKERININEIPAIKPLVDRMDLVFVFRTSRDEKAIREYAYKKSKQEDRKIPDYSVFLQKYIMYAKKRLDPKITTDAKAALNEHWIKIAGTFGSPRLRDTLYRLAKARARLKLKEVVDKEDANETIQFYNTNLMQYQRDIIITLPGDPRIATYNECNNILKESKSSHISFEELIKKARERNEQVNQYIDGDFKLRNNWKLRTILNILLDNPSIKAVQKKPIVLQWIDEDDEVHTITNS